MIIENIATKKQYNVVKAGWERIGKLKSLFKVIDASDLKDKTQIIDNLAPKNKIKNK